MEWKERLNKGAGRKKAVGRKKRRKEGRKTRPKVITIEGGKEGLREIGKMEDT